MICLDTNYLIRALIPLTPEAIAVDAWLRQGEQPALPMVAWYEFRCGPVRSEELLLAGTILTGGLLPFQEPQAAEAAQLFNAAGRLRRRRVDAMIAATAIVAGARLATSNRDDFAVFVPHGLRLV